MWIDKRLEFSDAQALAATGASTNHIDLGSDRDVGPGRPLWVVLQVDVALAGTGPSFKADIQTDDNTGFASPTVIASTETVTAAAAGRRFVVGMPFANERFLRLNYTLTGTGPSITVSAWLTDQEPQSWQAYPDAI